MIGQTRGSRTSFRVLNGHQGFFTASGSHSSGKIGPRLSKWLLQGVLVLAILGRHVAMCRMCTWDHCLLLCGGALDTAIAHLDTMIAGGGKLEERRLGDVNLSTTTAYQSCLVQTQNLSLRQFAAVLN